MIMFTLAKDFWTDEGGFLISMELVLIATIAVLGLIVGLSCLSNSVVTEMQDLAWSIRGLNQSYYFGGFRGCKSWVPGSAFTNRGSGQQAVYTENVDIGLNAAPLENRTVIIPDSKSSSTIICPPDATGPTIIQPNGALPSNVPSTVIPCPNQDCGKLVDPQARPGSPIPDSNIPVTPAPPRGHESGPTLQ